MHRKLPIRITAFGPRHLFLQCTVTLKQKARSSSSERATINVTYS